jgi:hypothetical protein
VIASRQDAGRGSCSSGLAGASGGEAGSPAKLLPRLAGLMSAGGVGCRCLLRVDSQLGCSLDASVAVTDVSVTSVSEVRIFIFFSGRCANQWVLEMTW